MQTRSARRFLFFFLAVLISLAIKSRAQTASFPHLTEQGTATQLVVGGKPFLILGGELGNSSASDAAYLRPFWANFKKMNLNTILTPIYWELVEPQEGIFDFSLVDSVIFSARANELKLVLLWFGSWKNSMSCYAPSWVKTDLNRFPRARTRDGKALEILTPFGDENRKSDIRAFVELMKHIRSIDERASTVIMVQVENEIGMLEDARDHCDKADRLFTEPVPSELMNYLVRNKKVLVPELLQVWEKTGYRSSGTWEQVFGTGLQTDELFMAWHFARYTNTIAKAGKEVYPLPMYVNAALIRPGYKPGRYPSAGPLPHLLDIWRAAAPDIDFLAPDIYFKNLVEWCEKYDRSGNPLFIPEAGKDQSPANAFYALGRHDAMGYSPFSIESLDHPESNSLSSAYNILKQLEPLILQNQGLGRMMGVLLDSTRQQAQFDLGDYRFTVSHEYSWPYAQKSEGDIPRFGGMVIMLAADEFLIAGSGILVTFKVRGNDKAMAGIERIDEGRYVEGKWTPGRRMNGDQSHQGRHLYLPGYTFGMQKIKLYKYQ